MSARSFRSVAWVAGVAATALGCYMVNLKVASERAALEEVETRIVLAERDIRLLQTEIGTRGRLAQLEKWNVKVLALSAPGANQFVDGGFQLATLVAPNKVVDPEAPVVLASAPAPQPQAAPRIDSDGAVAAPAAPAPASQLMHVASFKREVPAAVSAPRPAPKQKTVEKSDAKASLPADKPARTAKASADSAPKPKVKVAEAKVEAGKPAKAKPELVNAAAKSSPAKSVTKTASATPPKAKAGTPTTSKPTTSRPNTSRDAKTKQ